MKNVIIGQYIPGNSFFYRMDPRSKIISLMILMVASFILKDVFQIGIMLLFVFALLIIGKIPVGRILRGLRPLMYLLIFTFFFQILLNKTEPILYQGTLNFSYLSITVVILIYVFYRFSKKYVPFKMLYLLLFLISIFVALINVDNVVAFKTTNLAIYQGGVLMALYITLRLVVIVTLSTILTLSTKPTDLNLGLESILKPLKIIRFNTEELAMIISIALRYIPTLLDEANKIMLAQASRGVDFSEGKLKDKIMQVISLLVPMFIISFKRSDDLANAMEARSFVPGKPRTRLHMLTWNSIDTMTIIFSTIVFALSIYMVVS